MAGRAKAGDLVGRSGVQLSEVRHKVDNLDEKPYLTGVKGPHQTHGQRHRFDGNGIRSCGFGPSKVFCNEELPNGITDQHVDIVKFIAKKQPVSRETLYKKFPFENAEKVIDSLDMGSKRKGLNLICFSNREGGWVLSAEGERVASLQ